MPAVHLTQAVQVCVIVPDLEAAMAQYWNTLGIGPWQVYTFAAPDLKDTTVREQPCAYSMKLAVAMVGTLQWELIQPLAGPSIYKEFLDEGGTGIHHVLCPVENIEEAIRKLKADGVQPLMGGYWKGARYMYMDARAKVGTIIELTQTDPGFALPPPEATYP